MTASFPWIMVLVVFSLCWPDMSVSGESEENGERHTYSDFSAVSVFDSLIYRDLFSTEKMRSIFFRRKHGQALA